jgi:hypothetical protein
MTTQAQSVAVNGSQINTSGVMQVAGGGTGLSAVGTSGYVLASNGATNVYSNITGYSGYSGYSGATGSNGSAGASGTSGYSGATGTSGFSGYSGSSATGVSSLNGNTGALLGYDKIASATLSGNNSSVNITGIPTGYSQLIIMGEFRVDTGGADTVFPIRLSTNNGSSYIATSSYYQQFVYYDLGTGPNYSNFLADSGFGFAAVGGNGRGWMGGTTGYSTFCVIINQPTTTSFPSCQWNQGFQNTGSDYSWYWGTGFNNSTNSYINAFQITRQSGNKNITGGYINVFGTKVA